MLEVEKATDVAIITLENRIRDTKQQIADWGREREMAENPVYHLGWSNKVFAWAADVEVCEYALHSFKALEEWREKGSSPPARG